MAHILGAAGMFLRRKYLQVPLGVDGILSDVGTLSVSQTETMVLLSLILTSSLPL